MSDSFSSRQEIGNQTYECKKECSYDSDSGDHTSTGIDSISIINCALNAPLMLISILGNALVLAAITRTPSIRSTSMIMLCSLAVSDLLVGVIAQPLFIANELTRSKNVFVYNLLQIIGVSLCEVSLCTMTAITVDRFMALHFHMRYASLVTKPRVKCTVVIIWFSNCVLQSFRPLNERALSVVTAVVIVICLSTSTFCYAKIYRIVRRHQLQIHAQQQALQSSSSGNGLNIARMRRGAMSTFIFYIALILCYFPIYVLMGFSGQIYKNWKSEMKFVATVVFMNSSINPLLYYWRLCELRAAVLKTTKRLLCKETTQD